MRPTDLIQLDVGRAGRANGLEDVAVAHGRFFADEFLLTMTRMTEPEIEPEQDAEAKSRWRQARATLLITVLVILGLAIGLFFLLR
jgi:hypothetical protein